MMMQLKAMREFTSSFALMAVVALVGSGLTSCKQDTSQPKPSSQGAIDSSTQPVYTNPTTNTAVTSSLTGVQIAPEDPTALNITSNSQAQIRFRVTADPTKNLSIGLLQTPVGPTLSQQGSEVILTWASPVVGSYQITFIIRDINLCTSQEGNASVCTFTQQDLGNVGVKSYDTVSQPFTVNVTTGTGLANTGGTGGNGSLINQILSVLGGQGSGNVGGGNLGGLLSKLGNGQLQQILQQVTQGGSITNLLNGFTLQDSKVPAQPATAAQP